MKTKSFLPAHLNRPEPRFMFTAERRPDRATDRASPIRDIRRRDQEYRL